MKALVIGSMLSAVAATMAHASAFDDFQKICVETSSDAATALAAADAGGWQAAPDELLAAWRANKRTINPQGRVKYAGGKNMATVQVKDAVVDVLRVHDCALTTARVGGDKAYAQQAASWVAVPALTSWTDGQGTSTFYSFVVDGEQHKAFSPSGNSATAKVVAERRLRIALVIEGPEGTSVSIGVPWKVETP